VRAASSSTGIGEFAIERSSPRASLMVRRRIIQRVRDPRAMRATAVTPNPLRSSDRKGTSMNL
jgi:hypothetical protein